MSRINKETAKFALTFWFKNNPQHPDRRHWTTPKNYDPKHDGIPMDKVCQSIVHDEWEALMALAGTIPFSEIPAYYGK